METRHWAKIWGQMLSNTYMKFNEISRVVFKKNQNMMTQEKNIKALYCPNRKLPALEVLALYLSMSLKCLVSFIKLLKIWSFIYVILSALDDCVNLALSVPSVATSCANDWLFVSGLSGGRRWREQWTGSAGLTGSTHVSTAGWSSVWAGSPPHVSCWATKDSLLPHLCVVWTCGRPLPHYWSTEKTNKKHSCLPFRGDMMKSLN